jgi:hypothetical protein
MPRLASDLDANDNRISNLAIASQPADAVRLDYITALEARLESAQIQLLSYAQLLNAVNQEIQALKATVSQQNKKPPAVLAITEPVNIQVGGQIAVQGVGLVVGDRVLLTANGANNGIYVVANGAWQRAIDANEPSEFPSMEIEVMEGDYPGVWKLTNAPNPIVLGVSILTFGRVSSTFAILPVCKGGTGADNPRTARKNLGCVEQISFDYVGDGIETSFLFQHNLGQLYPFVKVFDRTHPQSTIFAEEYPIDENTIRVEFSAPPTLNSIAVSILGAVSPSYNNCFT